MLQVTDDSGFLALIVPASYKTFVARNWTLDQILGHFKQQMAENSLLIWGTGLEGFWNVKVVLEHTKVKGFREVTGPLQVLESKKKVSAWNSVPWFSM